MAHMIDWEAEGHEPILECTDCPAFPEVRLDDGTFLCRPCSVERQVLRGGDPYRVREIGTVIVHEAELVECEVEIEGTPPQCDLDPTLQSQPEAPF